MPSAEKPVTGAKATAEGLQQKMAQLRERIAQKRAKTDQKVEQSVDEKAVEWKGFLPDYQTTEKAMQKFGKILLGLKMNFGNFNK